MITVNFSTIGRYIWRTLIFSFHITRILLILGLGMTMAFLINMKFQDGWGMLATFIIVISLTDWFISVYLGNVFK